MAPERNRRPGSDRQGFRCQNGWIKELNLLILNKKVALPEASLFV
jgi:hypothetical protein